MLPIHNRKSQTHPFDSAVQPAQISHHRRSSIFVSKRRNSPLPILRLRVNVPSLNGNHATLNRADRRLRARTSSRCTRSSSRRTQTAERSHHAAGRHWDLDVFWAAGDEVFWQAVDMNALGGVVVRSRDDLDDLVARELQAGDVCGRTGHQVAVQNAEDGLVGDDEKVVLLALEFEDDGFEADGEIVVGLVMLV
jgi:hypothetical protein